MSGRARIVGLPKNEKEEKTHSLEEEWVYFLKETNMKILMRLGVGMLIIGLAITAVYGASKEEVTDRDNGQQNKIEKNDISTPNKSPSIRAAPKVKHCVHSADSAEGGKRELQRSHAIKREQEQVGVRAYLPEVQRIHQQKRYETTGYFSRKDLAERKNEKKLLSDLKDALIKLNHSRWSYNPGDERGQGNMGRVDMLAPFGHDKDSDRMELYGNRGRVIRIVEPIPEPEPEPTPEPEPIPEPEPAPEPTPEPSPAPSPPPEPPF